MADIPGNTTTQRMLRVGDTWSDTIELSTDQDWFRVWLVQGVTYHIRLDGSGGTPLGDPLLRVLDSTGTVELSRDDDGGGGLNSLIDFTAAATGTYFISAQGFGSATGQYTLGLTETDIEPAPTVANSIPGTSTTAVVLADGFVRGTLNNITYFDPLLNDYFTRLDDDWYRIDVQAGQEYNFVWSRAGATGATGVDITLYNAAGNVIWDIPNPGNSEWMYINWFPGSSGTWFIGVNGAATSGEYTLGVNRITDSPIEAISGATALQTNRVDVYFAQAGETFDGTTSEGWNAFEIAQAMAALGEYSKIANVTFSQTMVQADAEFTLVLDDNEQLGFAGRFGLPGGPVEGIGTFDGNWAGWSTTAGGAVPGEAIDQGGYGFGTMLHEFGHGLGLVHPHEDSFGNKIMHGVNDSEDHGDFDLNQGIYTVMSYNTGWETAPQGEPTKPDGKLDAHFGWTGTPMAFDIAVIQQKYGANTSYHTGNDTYTLPSADQVGTFYSCIWDAGGIDTIRADATTASCIIDLRAATLRYEPGGGGWVSYQTGIHGGFTIANGVVIENAIGGSGNDQITGNAANNVLDGGGGADSMIGGAGNDTYFVDTGVDGVSEDANAGIDTVFTTVNLRLAANVENLVLQGSALQAYGNALSNVLTGNAGNNLLDGDAGVDAMFGGAGNDVYFVDNGGDGVVENPNEGNDTVFSTAHLRLSANVENMVLQGSADLQGYGNNLNNLIQGNAGNNLLDGDAGADLMRGAAGNDTYFVDNGGDTIIENLNEGTDAVFSTGHFALSANVETLVLQGNADLQGYGNSLANLLYGNAGNNLLDGRAGADIMRGGAGNDSYFVDDAGDQVIEGAGQGNDTVFSTAHFALSANVETLVLQGGADLQGYGNSLANMLYGNAGNNLLDGRGGADVITGGAGNDSYFVDDAGDMIIENLNEGTDAVFSTAHFALSANVETLVLQGNADLQGYGNDLANRLYGNAGSNLLDGRGGADVMAGGAGNDTFMFTVGQGNSDTVVDFAGNAAAAGDALLFVGYGAGATFTNIDATHWQVNFNGGSLHEIITFSNAASIDASDLVFV